MVDMFEIFSNIFSLQNLLVMILGIIVGITIGALPGLTAVMAIALLIPFTFGMPPATGILLLMIIYKSAIYGGSLSAILLHTPGTPASAATAIDGYQMTRQGKAHVALRISTIASAFGSLVSGVALLTLAPPLSVFALRFGPPEYFLLAIFGLTVIASVSSGSIVKGIMAGAFGLLIGTVGVDINVGFPRFTFGIFQLQGGVSLVPAMIGLFSIPQVFNLAKDTLKKALPGNQATVQKVKLGKMFPSFKELMLELKETWKTMILSSIIGVIVGILPGAGADIASWVGYNEAKRFSKHPEKFGTGSLEGVAAPETANNAVTGSALIPLWTLGIPGSAAAAVILGGLMIHGLIPGRELFTVHAQITYTAIWGFIVASILMGLVGFVVIRYAALVVNIPNEIMMVIITALCVIGSFAITGSTFDVWTMLIFGIIGYFLRENDFHPAPLVLGMILGPMAEIRFTQSMVLSDGNLLGFMAMRPISIIIAILILISLATPFIMNKKGRRKTASEIVDE